MARVELKKDSDTNHIGKASLHNSRIWMEMREKKCKIFTEKSLETIKNVDKRKTLKRIKNNFVPNMFAFLTHFFF